MSAPVFPVASYLRVSRNRADCPLEIQEIVISRYASRYGFHVTKAYTDLGRSGLGLRRPGFRTLLKDVLSGGCNYRAVLVYDVSRWGRFQDSDAAAYYEYLCKSAGVPVHYCAEEFGNENRPQDLVLKSLKRIQAASYSRRLSALCFRGQKRLSELGFSAGGSAGYGFRRVLCSSVGEPNHTLAIGEYKSLAADRIILALGSRNEAREVRGIYKALIDHHMSPSAIARELNRRRVPREDGRVWTHSMVKNILTNLKYAGFNVWNRTSTKLQGPKTFNPWIDWVVKRQPFKGIIDLGTFQNAQDCLRMISCRPSQAELLDELREALAVHGKLTAKIISATENIASETAFRKHFGGLMPAYKLIGYFSPDRVKAVQSLQQVKRIRLEIVNELFAFFGKAITIEMNVKNGRLRACLEDDLEIAIHVCRKAPNRSGRLRWRLYSGSRIGPRDFDLFCLVNSNQPGALRWRLAPPLALGPIKQFITVQHPFFRQGLELRNLACLREGAERLESLRSYPRRS